MGKGFILAAALALPCTAGTHECTPGVLGMLSFLPCMSPDAQGTGSVPARSWQGLSRTSELSCGVLPGWRWCYSKEERNHCSTGSKLEVEKVPGFRGSDLIRASSSQGR